MTSYLRLLIAGYGPDLPPGVRLGLFVTAVVVTLIFDGVIPVIAWCLWGLSAIVGPQDFDGP